jgi:hypothetical protein
VAGGCLQEGALSPLLWSLIANELLWEFGEGDYYTVFDIAVLVNGKFSSCVRGATHSSGHPSSVV